MTWSESTQGLHYCDLYDDDSDLLPSDRCFDCRARKVSQSDKFCRNCTG